MKIYYYFSDQARFTGGGFNLKSAPKPSAVTA
jgi:hypothetical protein